MTEDIRAKINGFLGQPIVKKLRVKTMTQSSLFSSPRPSTRDACAFPARHGTGHGLING